LAAAVAYSLQLCDSFITSSWRVSHWQAHLA